MIIENVFEVDLEFGGTCEPLLTLAIDGIPLVNALLFKERWKARNDGFMVESGLTVSI
jgi:hypothetical protein